MSIKAYYVTSDNETFNSFQKAREHEKQISSKRKYEVEIEVRGLATVKVEANSDDEAIQIATEIVKNKNYNEFCSINNAFSVYYF